VRHLRTQGFVDDGVDAVAGGFAGHDDFLVVVGYSAAREMRAAMGRQTRARGRAPPLNLP
jgi:hypothetical protein